MHSGVLSTSAMSFVDVHNLALDELKKQFLALFPRRGESIRKNPEHKRWFTQHGFALSDGQIIAAIDGRLKHFVGSRFADRTRFAVLDIDADSPYHNVLSLVRLRRLLEGVGMNNTHVYQSSESGGWHLYVFFDQWVDAGEMNKLLGAWLRKNAFTVKSGTLEIFPSANGLRIPLQRGFAFLADNCRREQLTLDESLRRFIADSFIDNDWSAAANELAQQLVKPRQDYARKKKRSGLIPDRWKLGQLLWQQGLQFYGQRHDAILAVEHYLWYGDDDLGVEPMPGYHYDAAREQLVLNWLESKHNGLCKHINKGDWRTVENDVRRACAWRTSENIHQPYAHTERKIERMMEDRTLTPRRFITGNIARYNFALRRITAAYNDLSTGGRMPSINEVARKAGSDWKTVRKHWNLLAGSGGDQSLRIDQPVLVLSSPDPAPKSLELVEIVLPDGSFPQAENALSETSATSFLVGSSGSVFPLLEKSQLFARLLLLNAETQDSFRSYSLPLRAAGPVKSMSLESRNEEFSRASDASLARRVDPSVFAELYSNGSLGRNSFDLKSSEQTLVAQGILAPADMILPALPAEQKPSNVIDRRDYFKQQAEECYRLAQLNGPAISPPSATDLHAPSSVRTESGIAQGYALDYVLKRSQQQQIESSHQKFDGKNAANNDEFLDMFLNGSGNDYQMHTRRGDPVLEQFIASPGVSAIREQYSNLQCPGHTDKLGYSTKDALFDTLLKPAGDSAGHFFSDLFDEKHLGSVATQVGGFGNPPKEYPWATASATRCTAEGKADPKGDFVEFNVKNIAGLHSWAYHVLPDKPMNEDGPYRSIVQVFDWIEPLPSQKHAKQLKQQ